MSDRSKLIKQAHNEQWPRERLFSETLALVQRTIEAQDPPMALSKGGWMQRLVIRRALKSLHE